MILHSRTNLINNAILNLVTLIINKIHQNCVNFYPKQKFVLIQLVDFKMLWFLLGSRLRGNALTFCIPIFLASENLVMHWLQFK